MVTPDNLSAILGKEADPAGGGTKRAGARRGHRPCMDAGGWGDPLYRGDIHARDRELTLTGQLGDVMKESATISSSLIRSRLAGSGNTFNFITSDIHIHVPSGATPKDGPSAGVTLFTALASLITGKTVDPELAMTGEITLSGAVLPVGGIREKVLAAHRAGIKKVILPKENERDLPDVPEEVRGELVFVPVGTVEEVLKEALGLDLPRPIIVQTGNSFVPVQNA